MERMVIADPSKLKIDSVTCLVNPADNSISYISELYRGRERRSGDIMWVDGPLPALKSRGGENNCGDSEFDPLLLTLNIFSSAPYLNKGQFRI